MADSNPAAGYDEVVLSFKILRSSEHADAED
jgi:hypothetical protein